MSAFRTSRRLRPNLLRPSLLSHSTTLGMACALAGAMIATGAHAQDVAITNVTLATGDGSDPIQNATVVVRGGKVVSAGTGTAPAGTTVIDGTGKWATPGIFATMTSLGLLDVDGVGDSNDTRAGSARFNAAMDVTPALNPASQNVAVSRAGGVTRASVVASAARAIFAGQGAIVDLGNDPQMVVGARAFQLASLGEGGARLAGGSRIAAHQELRNALREARDFANGSWSGEDNLLTRADAEALGPVLAGRQTLYVAVERAADIRAVLALRSEFPALKLVLVGASEGWLVAREIAAAGVPVLADGLDDLPDSFEQLASTQSNIGRMAAAGVKVAIAGSMEQPRWLTQYAGNLVALTRVPRASGLSWGQALAAITSVPAEISGYGGQLGVLKPGAAGDVVLWDGDPLDTSSAPQRVWIDGVEQPLDNHQTRLRERYRDLDESELPKAYDW